MSRAGQASHGQSIRVSQGASFQATYIIPLGRSKDVEPLLCSLPRTVGTIGFLCATLSNYMLLWAIRRVAALRRYTG